MAIIANDKQEREPICTPAALHIDLIYTRRNTMWMTVFLYCVMAA